MKDAKYKIKRLKFIQYINTYIFAADTIIGVYWICKNEFTSKGHWDVICMMPDKSYCYAANVDNGKKRCQAHFIGKLVGILSV